MLQNSTQILGQGSVLVNPSHETTTLSRLFWSISEATWENDVFFMPFSMDLSRMHKLTLIICCAYLKLHGICWPIKQVIRYVMLLVKEGATHEEYTQLPNEETVQLQIIVSLKYIFSQNSVHSVTSLLKLSLSERSCVAIHVHKKYFLWVQHKMWLRSTKYSCEYKTIKLRAEHHALPNTYRPWHQIFAQELCILFLLF